MRGRRWLAEADRLDVAVYAAIAATDTPALDRSLRTLSHAADYSRLSIASALALSAAGGPGGRRAARAGLASVAVTATVVNLVMKPLGRRRRPERQAHEVVADRHVRMPVSSSFPSGHSAAAFSFATGVGSILPGVALPLHALALSVAYSRVHTGVHYPGDVVVGAVTGVVLAQCTVRAVNRA
ncbi:MAG TPA: phosphatase PAP2 family protein [Thermoleophilaceae bacterium]|nr:phosphatase PAP2 family protein [Thermoleophilaceae bacterium]